MSFDLQQEKYKKTRLQVQAGVEQEIIEDPIYIETERSRNSNPRSVSPQNIKSMARSKSRNTIDYYQLIDKNTNSISEITDSIEKVQKQSIEKISLLKRIKSQQSFLQSEVSHISNSIYDLRQSFSNSSADLSPQRSQYIYKSPDPSTSNKSLSFQDQNDMQVTVLQDRMIPQPEAPTPQFLSPRLETKSSSRSMDKIKTACFVEKENEMTFGKGILS